MFLELRNSPNSEKYTAFNQNINLTWNYNHLPPKRSIYPPKNLNTQFLTLTLTSNPNLIHSGCQTRHRAMRSRVPLPRVLRSTLTPSPSGPLPLVRSFHELAPIQFRFSPNLSISTLSASPLSLLSIPFPHAPVDRSVLVELGPYPDTLQKFFEVIADDETNSTILLSLSLSHHLSSAFLTL